MIGPSSDGVMMTEREQGDTTVGQTMLYLFLGMMGIINVKTQIETPSLHTGHVLGSAEVQSAFLRASDVKVHQRSQSQGRKC